MATFDGRRDEIGGRLWLADHYDVELARHNERLRAASAIRPADRVLDVGCGGGQSTRDAARAAVSGSALGVDLSEAMIERARGRTAEEGPDNVAYELGDAQVHRFRPAHFDVVISRFGTMFFADPVAAFGNIARAARPGARVVMMVWQGHDKNEWATAIEHALTGGFATSAQLPARSDPFSLGDPATVESILGAAGFVDVGFTDVDAPVYYGADADAALDLVSDMRMAGDLLAGLDPAAAARALARVRETLVAHETGQGVQFASRSWIVTARRAVK